MEKLYKILVDGRSCHGGDLKWSLPTKKGNKWIPGEWHEVRGDLKICKRGLHLTKEPFMWYRWGCTNYEAEVEDIISWDGDKCVARRARLLKEVPHPKWWNNVEGWVETLKSIAWLKPDGKPKKKWKLFKTRDAARNAARNAAGAAAWDAAGAAAWDAAVAAAAWDAARNAAVAAAWDAALDAAGAAAWDAAGAAALDAAEDAALYSRALVSNWNFESKHRIHIKKRMEVWQKGYGLLGDVDGVLYVYEKI